MPTIRISTPSQQDILPEYQEASDLREEILQAVQSGPAQLDFREVEFIETAELTPLACLINELRTQGNEIEILEPEKSWVSHWFYSINFPNGTTNPP